MKRDLWFQFPSFCHFTVLIGRHDTLYEGILLNQRPSYVSRARGITILFRLRMSAVYFLAATKCLRRRMLRHFTGFCSSKTQRSILCGAGGLKPPSLCSACGFALPFLPIQPTASALPNILLSPTILDRPQPSTISRPLKVLPSYLRLRNCINKKYKCRNLIISSFEN